MSWSEVGDHETPRSRAHRLLDAVPDERVSDAVDMLQRLAEPGSSDRRRRFRTVGVFDGEPDLGGRVKDIARGELGNGSSQTA